ncbi:hypothetical protein EB093_04680 [bacterium]|nr:hypothetical protein [bacterium]
MALQVGQHLWYNSPGMKQWTRSLFGSEKTHNSQPPIRGSVIGQIALNGVIRLSKRTSSQFLNGALRWAKRAISHPTRLVRYSVKSVDLIVRMTDPLPFKKLANPHYMEFLTDLTQALVDHNPNLSVTVLGAKSGTFVPYIRPVGNFNILAIEPNPSDFRILNRNMLPIPNVSTSNEMTPASDIAPNLRIVVISASSDPLTALPHFVGALQSGVPVIVIEVNPVTLPTGPFLELIDHMATKGYSAVATFDTLSYFHLSCDISHSETLSDIHHYFKRISTTYFMVLGPTQDEAITSAFCCTQRSKR